MRNTQFNIDAIPLDAYLILWRSGNLEYSRDSLLNLNQGWLFDVDNDLYDNRIDMADKLLCGFPSVAREYRWLNQLISDIPKHERANHTAVFEAAYANEEVKHFESFMHNLISLHKLEYHHRAKAGIFPGMTETIVTPPLDRFRVENMGSWGVATLERAKAPAERIFTDSMRLLHNYWEHSGFQFRLRHPLAMGNAMAVDKLLASRHPISNPEIALGEARWKSYSRLKDLAPNAFPSGIDSRHLFDRWSRLTASATFTHEDDDDNRFIQCLTPASLPAILTMPSHDRLPLTLERHLLPSLGDEWQWIQRLDIAEIIDGKVDRVESDAHCVPHQLRNLGWLACMAASIISMNIKVGSGQSRIKWLHSVMNATHVGEAMTLAPMILDRANERIHRS